MIDLSLLGDFKRLHKPGCWWHTPLIPALRRQRQTDVCEFESSKKIQRISVSKKQKKDNPHAESDGSLDLTPPDGR